MAIRLIDLISRDEPQLLDEWMSVQLAATSLRGDLLMESELREQSRQFLSILREALLRGGGDDLDGADWSEARAFLADLSRSRALKGFSPREMARFVFSLKEPLFQRAAAAADSRADGLAAATWRITTTLDGLGLYTTEAYQKAREEVITRQQQELLELSTPVVQLWDRILALPLIGTLDSSRTQVVMESLLQRIVETEAAIAIIDITGVPTVDTLVAQYLLKTVAAARLMGADCIICGIRPQIAQTIVHLGVDLNTVATKATLADAFRLAISRVGAPLEPARAQAAPSG